MRTIAIQAKPLRSEHISPLIYGEFVEFLNDMIPGMWADKLQDRSFAGLSEPAVVYRRDWGYPPGQWRTFRCGTGPYGAPLTGDVSFDRDTDRPFVGAQSARITLAGAEGCIGGILQSGIAVTAGQPLDFAGYFRTADPGGPLEVLLGRDYGAYFDAYDALSFRDIGAEWEPRSGTLISPVTDADASLAIALTRSGTLWAGRASLMPQDALEGWRPDVVAAVKALKPGCIRFGGSSLIYYDWESGVGPRERRAPFVNHPWGSTEEHDVGIVEFIRFGRLVRAEPLICVNSNSSSPEHIANQVEYCNGASSTPYGRRRAQDGYARPFGVKYWQIGNEQSGPEYEDLVATYARAMKAVDPTICIVASYPSERLVGELGGEFDVVCPHFYGPDVAQWAGEIEQLRKQIRASRANRGLKLGITEWNHTAGDWGDQRAWLLTLYNSLHVARMLNLYQRNSDLVTIANRSNLCNSACSGSLQTGPSGMYVTPAHHVQSLYANECGDVPLTVRTGAGEGLDVMATRDERRGRVCITIVNTGGEPQSRSLRLDGFDLAQKPVQVITLAGPALSTVNGLARGDRVHPVRKRAALESLDALELPPYSLTMVVVRST